MSIDAEGVLGHLLAKVCASCGTGLPAPGMPCGECGNLPAVTRPELEEILAGPGKLAGAEADRLRGEADALATQRFALLVQADQVEQLAGLEHAASLARRALDTASEAEQHAAAVLGAAHQAHETEAAGLAEATAAVEAAQQALDTAVRMREGVDAENEAQAHLDAAVKTAARHQSAEAAAQGAMTGARTALTAAGDERRRREAERDTAAAAVESPGRTPRSEITVTRDILRALFDPQATPMERAYAAIVVSQMAETTGAADGFRAEGRAAANKEHDDKIRAERDQIRRDRIGPPQHLRPLMPGN